MNKSDLKIVFFGTPEFAVPVLQEIIDGGYNISAVFAGHGPVEFEASKHAIKVFAPKSLKHDEAVFEEFKNLNPDICIVAAYGKILPQKFLDVPRYGFINIHPSLLPKYRGPSPIQTAILNGNRETGVTIMVVDSEVDHGPILAEEKYFVDKNKDLITISEEIFGLGARLLIKILPGYIAGEIKPKEQAHDQATFTKMFKREDGRINWNESEDKIYSKVIALNPEPGTWTTWKSKVINISNVTMFDIVSPQVADLESEIPGMIRRIGDNIAVTTKKCYLILKSIQLEGRKEMDAKSFINGHPDFLNSKLE